jgi:hypothetical protein
MGRKQTTRPGRTWSNCYKNALSEARRRIAPIVEDNQRRKLARCCFDLPQSFCGKLVRRLFSALVFAATAVPREIPPVHGSKREAIRRSWLEKGSN